MDTMHQGGQEDAMHPWLSKDKYKSDSFNAFNSDVALRQWWLVKKLPSLDERNRSSNTPNYSYEKKDSRYEKKKKRKKTLCSPYS